MFRKILSALIGSFVVLAILPFSQVKASHVDPVFVAGNPNCPAGMLSLKVEPVISGNYSDNVLDVNFVVNSSANGPTFDWSSNIPVDAVIAKGGPNANVYYYNPPTPETSDTGLHAPVNANNNQYYGLSHITFCYIPRLIVSKTAQTSFDRTWTWDIQKSADQIELTLADGQIYTVNYTLNTTTSSTDRNWAVSGTISIQNPYDISATITGVSDEVSSGIFAGVDCGTTFPFVLAAGANLNCSYTSSLPDATDRINTVTVATSGTIQGSSANADVDFENATITKIDDCVTLTDSNVAGLNDVICYDQAPSTVNYSLNLGKNPQADVILECGENTHINTAVITTNSTSTQDSSSWTVSASVECAAGCSLTQGYWKTHNASFKGGAPIDEAWELLGANKEQTAFFISGKTWFEVFWTAPKGNSYYQLAHQYMAAKLNVLNGATAPSSVSSAISSAETLFSTYSPTTNFSKIQKTQMLLLSSVLGSFNEGIIGPGHCSE